MKPGAAEERADFFIMYCVRAGSVWGLRDAQGWRLLRDAEGGEAFPAWPKREDAQAAAAEGENAEAISLQDWTGQWLPGMAAEGTRIAIHPLGGDDGVITEAGELLEEFVEELEEMGG
jgi:hypothetical protein